MIRAGNKASIQSGQMPTDPEPLSDDEKKALEIVAKDNRPEAPSDEEPPEPSNTEEIGAIQSPVNTDTGKEMEEEPDKDEDSGSGTGFKMGAVIGAATIDDQIYSVIGLRPEFSIGKLGICLDLSFYMDKDGNIRKDNWDSPRDIFEKLYYVRWGHQGDPFYIKVGAIDNYRLGFGLLMNHYYNTIQLISRKENYLALI